MPCRSEYLNPNDTEKELSRVLLLLDELDGKGPPELSKYGRGYDDRAYLKQDQTELLHQKTAELCSRLTALPDVTAYSLEMQLWWRDHSTADRKRDYEERMLRRTAYASVRYSPYPED